MGVCYSTPNKDPHDVNTEPLRKSMIVKSFSAPRHSTPISPNSSSTNGYVDIPRRISQQQKPSISGRPQGYQSYVTTSWGHRKIPQRGDQQYQTPRQRISPRQRTYSNSSRSSHSSRSQMSLSRSSGNRSRSRMSYLGDPNLICGRYYYIKKLADTHYGTVWEGWDAEMGRRIAVKQSDRTSALERCHHVTKKRIPEDILKEIDIHQYLVKNGDFPDAITDLYNVHHTEEDIFMVMEFGDGGSLFDYLQAWAQPLRSREMGEKYLDWKIDLQRWFKDMAVAIQFMHAQNICHKDLSLQNVLLKKSRNGDRWDVKILDFGLAEWWPSENLWCFSMQKVGKSNFASPECFDPNTFKFDAKANDCWCLGVILFMCLTKCSPFENPLDGTARELMGGTRSIWNLLSRWGKSHLVNNTEVHLLSKIFDDQRHRLTIDDILEHKYCRVTPKRSNARGNWRQMPKIKLRPITSAEWHRKDKALSPTPIALPPTVRSARNRAMSPAPNRAISPSPMNKVSPAVRSRRNRAVSPTPVKYRSKYGDNKPGFRLRSNTNDNKHEKRGPRSRNARRHLLS